MPHKLPDFSARIKEELKRRLVTGELFNGRNRGNKVTIKIPKVDVPHMVFGTNPCGEIPLTDAEECLLPVPTRKRKKQLRSIDDDWVT